MGFPQFPHPPSDHSDPHTPGGSWAPAIPGLRRFPWAFAVTRAARLPLVPCGVITTGLQDSLGIVTDWPVAPPKGLSTLGFDARGFPPDAASLLQGLLAATPTGLSPAGGCVLRVGQLGGITSPGAHVAGHDLMQSVVERPVNLGYGTRSVVLLSWVWDA